MFLTKVMYIFNVSKIQCLYIHVLEKVTMGHSWGELTQTAQDRGEWKLL